MKERAILAEKPIESERAKGYEKTKIMERAMVDEKPKEEEQAIG